MVYFCVTIDLLRSTQVVANIILDGVLGGVFTALSGMFVVPTLASDHVRRDIGRVVVGLGHSLSGFAPSPNIIYSSHVYSQWVGAQFAA